MKIWHRIGFNRLDQVDQILDDWGIEYKKSMLPGDSYILTFSIAESDPRWPEVSRLAAQKKEGYLGMVWTTFEPEEILAAEWIRLCPGFMRGYPQPASDFGYIDTTFGWHCGSCGLDGDQKAPFRIKKEARLGKYDFMSLYWTYSICCKHQVAARIQEEGLRGIEVWPVMLHKDRPSEVISQLLFPGEAAPGLDEAEKRKPELCPECGRTKYAFHVRGYMHLQRSALRDDVDAQRSYEWFGSGGNWGFQEILISNRFARLILTEKWLGAILKPLKLL